MEVVHQFLNQATDTVLQPVEAETLVYNFRENTIKDPSYSSWDTTLAASTIKFFGGMANKERRRRGLFGDDNEEEQEQEQRREFHEQEQEVPKQELDQTKVTFGFPILDLTRDIPMKNIPPSTLPHFQGMTSEDPDSFLFEYDILCHIYNYVRDAQKLKLFPATLKDLALRWFMGLGEHTLRTWEEMRTTILKKYQEYCRTRDS